MFVLSNVIQKYKKKEFLNIKNYSFPKKGLVLIKGPNGCGKSTLLKTMLGLIPYEGNITFQNRNLRDCREDIFKKVCYVPQFNTLFDDLTLEENLNLNNLFLNQQMDNYPSTKKIKKLSGGQQKQANLDRCRSFFFDCYILDEPTTSLDKLKKQELLSFLNKEKESKLIICVSHDEAIEEIANDVLLMDRSLSLSSMHELDYDLAEIKKESIKIPLKYYFNIFNEDRLLTAFKFCSTLLLLILFFIAFHIFTLNRNDVDRSYLKNILNYSFVTNETAENVYEGYIQEDSFFDMAGFSITSKITLKKKEDLIPIQVQSIYFSKTITEAIVSDFVINSSDYSIVLKKSTAEEIISIKAIEKTNKDLFKDNATDQFYYCSYIILPFSCLEKYFSFNANNLSYVISKEDVLPNGYKYTNVPSDYWDLNESYFFPRIIVIAMLVLVYAIFVYSEFASISERKNKIILEQKLRIFGADEKSIHKALYVKELLILGCSLILSIIGGILIMYFWISHYTSPELKQIDILSTPIRYEFIPMLFFITALLFCIHYLFIRRKS